MGPLSNEDKGRLAEQLESGRRRYIFFSQLTFVKECKGKMMSSLLSGEEMEREIVRGTRKTEREREKHAPGTQILHNSCTGGRGCKPQKGVDLERVASFIQEEALVRSPNGPPDPGVFPKEKKLQKYKRLVLYLSWSDSELGPFINLCADTSITLTLGRLDSIYRVL